jgi:hypothetical protein
MPQKLICKLVVLCQAEAEYSPGFSPERALLAAYLERALRDLTAEGDGCALNRRSAIRWFRGAVRNTSFTFQEVIEELGLSIKYVHLINARVLVADQLVVRDRQLAKEKDHANQSEAKREACRVTRSTLAKRKRMFFGPENPTIQWNSWNVRCGGA